MELVIGLLIALTFILIIIGVPIYISLLLTGLLSLAALAASTGTPMATIAVSQALFNGMGSLPLLAIPFFMLAGEIMNRGGITEKLIRFAMLLIGRLPGGLAHVSIVSSMFFGGITGSAQACASCMGGILIPAMKKEGYKTSEAAGVIAAASTCGPIIPPSIIMVVYATAVGASVGAMFMGGIIPGILCGGALMIVVLLRNRVCHFPRRTEKLAKGEVKQVVIDAIIPLGMPIIVVGGIMGGICTPTEAGAIAVVYSLGVSLIVTRTLKISEMGSILLHSVNSSAPLLLIIACAKVFSYGLTALQMPILVNDLILSITSNKYVFLLLVNILLLIMGMFMDGGAAVIILAPILAPVAASMGISLIHFGIVMAFNLTIGNITPPLGYCLFITSKIGKIPVESVVKGTMPYLAAEVIVLLLLTYIPFIVTFIPGILGYAL
ncbi:TRAP transporter large permease [Ohessyouella blattaphilus]|uniref:TRAP transporter large permease n=1 Tax=Ohessyouella blattaphilus TaxID=2949333 RepID=A0ABT1EMY0_9FIRM|nr:TRAP transporter large permease [Ohessyouella blattaphilus]MCP1111147.1 TRAP transporter large permease [Ohessyouella blattaphilus]MCR8564541.1 TRAP transporter large permease [Ohessyouella blattaphilus]